MLTAAPTLALLAALALGAAPQESATADAPFPPSTALAEGVSPEALAQLGALVQGLVDDEEIVGAELLVLKNGRSILHEAYGWKDLEAQVPMQTGSVFCVRSMTKPLIGAAILMLIEEDRLDLDDPVAQYLPGWDGEGQRDITVEHLLTHTSGLPFSRIAGEDPRTLESIQAVAELGAGAPLEFEPGTAFQYSDQGTDTLTALIEVVTGAPAEDFVRARVLDPLGMDDTACILAEDSPLRDRALPKYAGSRGAWTRFWSPDDAPLFPIFLGSQGLYSTLEDYARFMDLWRNRGRADSERLLRARSVRKALAPGPHPMNGSTGFPGLSAEYGYLMQLWTDAEEDDDVVAFGHTGSDGTHAWVFPEQQGMVLYFTQSRANTTGLRVEEALGELFLGVPFDPNVAAPPFEDYLGYYWEGEGDLYRAIVRDGDDLALEILAKAAVPLTYVGGDRWKLRPQPNLVLEFDRSATGEVTGYHIGDHQEFRFEPSAELPSADDVAARVAEAHRLDLLETLGPLRLSSDLDFEKLGIQGQITMLLDWPDRFRIDTKSDENFEHLAFDGEQLRYVTSTQSATTLEGQRAELLRASHPLARFGDWKRWYPQTRVIQRLERGSREVFIVRTGDTSAPARTLYVDTELGLVVREDSLTFVDTLGRIGQRLSFGNYRDVSGMQLPHRTELELANPLIGKIVSTVTETELGVELPADAFALEE